MSMFGKFFEKKATDRRFKKAGQGQRLGDASEHKGAVAARQQAALDSLAQDKAARQRQQRPAHGAASVAGQAALQRLEERSKPRPKRSLLDQERDAAQRDRAAQQELLAAQEVKRQAAAAAAVDVDLVVASQRRVRFICPLSGQRLRARETREHIIHCLQQMMAEQPLEASAQLIQTGCREAVALERCLGALNAYLGNAIEHPGEAKYRRIRRGNKAFQERVVPVLGALEFLAAVGFAPQTEEETEFLVLPPAVDTVALEHARTILATATRCVPRLDRNMQVLPPSTSGPLSAGIQLPDDFFEVTVDDVRLQQERLASARDKELSLRTQAMRDQDRAQGKRKYKFMVLRVRFPDGFVMEGTFRALESLRSAYAFVREKICSPERGFYLHTHPGRTRLEETGETTLKAAGLVPSAVVNFAWQDGGGDPYLNEEVFALALSAS